ncbi:Phage terminase-like protein, large subunit [Mycobacteroides abscessus subsp. massiliense]|nr:Phage terminase-like protein, large subunit [Mycobacteroides abscessus subsp. massiliense]
MQEIAYDRWNANQLINNLTSDGAPMLTMGQGFASMSAPTKDLQRLIRIGARTDENGLPIKPMIRHGGNPKIDGVVGLIMALSRALAAREVAGTSAYEDEGLMIV